MVWIDNTPHRPLHLSIARIDESQTIRQRIGHDDGFFVRSQIQMMGLFTGRNALTLYPGNRINHTDIRLQRIENKQRGLGSPGHHTQHHAKEENTQSQAIGDDFFIPMLQLM